MRIAPKMKYTAKTMFVTYDDAHCPIIDSVKHCRNGFLRMILIYIVIFTIAITIAITSQS